MVVDSSVIVKWLNTKNEANVEKADKVLKDAESGKIGLIAPELSKYEIGNALLNKNLKLSQALDALATSYSLPVTFVPETQDLALETYRMAQKEEITYYDASFTALAKQVGATLITDNPKHQAKVEGVKVLPLENYK